MKKSSELKAIDIACDQGDYRDLAQVRSMVHDMEAIQTEKAGSPEQANLLTRAGHKLASLIGDNLSTQSRKTTIELNLALLKITHEVKQGKE
jgi:hypothetical protein